MVESKFVRNEYADGAVITIEWDTLYSGEWPFGDTDVKIIRHKTKFY